MTWEAEEVLFLHFINGKTKQQAIQYDFWETEYHRKPLDLLKQLTAKGAIHQSDDLSFTLTQFTVPIIKDLLKKAGLKVSGNKIDLIERVKAHREFIDLSHLNMESVYTVDESLETFLYDTIFLNYISLHGPVTIDDAYSYYLRHQDLNASELIIALHERRIEESLLQSNKYEAVKCHHLLSEYYTSELHDNDKSLYHLNHFSMLIVLESIQRFQQLNPAEKKDTFFNIDNYTIEKYRNMLIMKQLDINVLYSIFLEHSVQLPYSEEETLLAVQFIIRCIIGSESAEEKLIDDLAALD